MSNSAIKLIDTQKRVVYKLFGDAAEARTLKIDAGSLSSALNANNQLLGALTDRKAFYQLNLKHVEYAVSQGVVKLSTDGSGVNSVITLSQTGDMHFDHGGFGNPINVVSCAVSGGSTGNVFLEYVGATDANAAYTIILDFAKDNKQFDGGKFADPTAFNWSSGNNGTRGPQ